MAVAGAFGIAGLRQNTAALKAEVSALKRQTRELQHVREDNQRLQTLTAQLKGDEKTAAHAIEAQLVEARREIADLEQRAAEAGRKHAAHATAIDGNRDPEKGLTRLEHCQNAGRGTPAAAFQTLVWAAMKGDHATLAKVCYVDDATRLKAQALLATLPGTSQKKSYTPESLAALAVAGEIMKGTAIHIGAHAPIDSLNTLLSIRTGESGREVKLPMRLGAEGWQLVVPERAIEAIKRSMSAQAPQADGEK